MVHVVVRPPERRVVAVDTSSLQRYYAGLKDDRTADVDDAMLADRVVLPPIVLTEALSEPDLTPERAARLYVLPLLTITDGYWERAGTMRGWLLSQGLRAKLADTLIAQSCIDHDIPSSLMIAISATSSGPA